MNIKQYQQRVADFPTVIEGRGITLDSCVLGLMSAVGRLERLAQRTAADPTAKSLPETKAAAAELSGEMLWLIAVVSNEFGVDMEACSEEHLRRLAEAARKHLE